MPARFYKVGGCVRDALLGRPVKDNDWVVVGGKPEDMLSEGYRQVGKDFPVFLHPTTKEEYALARTERKTGEGHTGFAMDTREDISLEDDLRRRDLTVNAMAMTADGEIIDPYGGRGDLKNGILRHVSSAFVEDPLRVLRVARFASQLCFSVAPETIALMKDVAESGELNSLPVERVWQEWRKAFEGQNPVTFFQVLSSCDALTILFPPCLSDDKALRVLAEATDRGLAIPARFAAHLAAIGPDQWPASDTLVALCNRYRVPNAYRELSVLAVNCRHNVPPVSWKAKELLDWLNAADAFRRQDRFSDLLSVLHVLSVIMEEAEFYLKQLAVAEQARTAVVEADKDDKQSFISPDLTGAAIGEAIKAHRLELIAASLSA